MKKLSSRKGLNTPPPFVCVYATGGDQEAVGFWARSEYRMRRMRRQGAMRKTKRLTRYNYGHHKNHRLTDL